VNDAREAPTIQTSLARRWSATQTKQSKERIAVKPDAQRLSDSKLNHRLSIAPSAGDVLFGAPPIADPTFISAFPRS